MSATKARINRVAYIGWRGIHGCEVLDLDKGALTGLIGPSGAGKSTLVMCLDYALLPDRRALNIRPISDLQDLQESGVDSLSARIDPKYGYAYVVLDITTRQDTRLIAGICVHPIDGRAEFTRWVIRNAPDDKPLQEMMSISEGDDEYHPDFPEWKRTLAKISIDVVPCRTVGEYGQALYEAGVLPSGMSMSNDRRLYANLIETTFKGGISHEVAARLKEYLLPEASQVPEIIRGLDECTNEVIKTRRALSDADRELELLKATYGVGKEIALDSIRWISHEKQILTQSLHESSTKLENMELTAKGFANTIPEIEKEIGTAIQTKTNVLETALLELSAVSNKITQLAGQRHTCKSAMAVAQGDQVNFTKGKKLWREIADQHENQDYDWIKQWLDNSIRLKNQEIAELDVKLRGLQEEANRLTTERASDASEILADRLDAQSLEHALRGVDEADAVALEMKLGGLTDGVVGVDIEALKKLPFMQDLPEIFWLGKSAPRPEEIHRVGDWLLSIVGDGYVVTSKNHLPIFGSEARVTRRKAILLNIDSLSRTREKFVLELNNHDPKSRGLETKREALLTNSETISFYLTNRLNESSIDDLVRRAQQALDECASGFQIAEEEQRTQNLKIQQIQKPYDERIESLRKDGNEKKTKLDELQKDIQHLSEKVAIDERNAVALADEKEQAKNILGSDFDQMYEASLELEKFRVEGLVSTQARRIAALGVALAGESTARLSVLQAVNADDRLSTLRIWPILMDIVRERIDTELADLDGIDLIQTMQNRRANLDGELVKQETEVKIKARNIHLAITSHVQSQRKKIEKLSELGENIEFGNVIGIQIKLTPRMEMLAILESFAAQPSLFSSQKPADQVLKDFFQASMVRKIDLSADALLDYRNYADLVIEARRKGGEWKPATSLSGGESIGCGLAIALMLTRSIASKGEIKVDQIYPLFAVDEVQRLDPAGQNMIVSFAEREGFQVLVTAVGLTPGYDCTLYALSRVFEPDERLIIRGVKVKREKVAA